MRLDEAAPPRAAEEEPAVRRAATLTAFAAGIVIAAQIGGMAVRDGLFLSTHPANDLPKVMLVGVALSLVAVLVMTRGLSRLGPARAVPYAFVASAVLFAGEWLVLPRVPGAVAVFAYLHIAAVGGVMVSGFWSVVTERFDPRTAKRLIGRINTGGALGGLLGGLVVQQSTAWVDIRTMLLGLAIANVVGAFCVASVAGPKLSRSAAGLGLFDGLRIVKETPYLHLLGALVALTGAAAALSDFAFKSLVASEIHHGETMAGFFALFYGISSVSTLLVQVLFARRALEKLGLSGTISILPKGVLLVGLVGATLTHLVTVTLLRGVVMTLSHSLFRSAYELFFTPLQSAKKRPTKAIIDVAFDRAGDALASVVVIVAVFLLPARAPAIAIGGAVVASAIAIWVALRLNDGYVGALREELKTSAIVLAPEDVIDATTRSTMAGSPLAMDRETLMREIQKLRVARAASPAEPRLAPAAPAPSGGETSALASVLATIEDLVAADVDRTARALARPLDPRVAPFVIGLIGRPELRHEALAALRRANLRVAGQVADALLDATTPASVRLRLPPLLEHVGDQRAADALIEGLRDLELDVRTRCAHALARMSERSPELHLSRSRLVDIAMRELDRLTMTSEHRAAILAHVFDVLALAIGERALRLAWSALGTNDERLHGTALEYIENVLPEALRTRVWPHLNDRRVKRPATRPRALIADELRASMVSVPTAPSDSLSDDPS